MDVALLVALAALAAFAAVVALAATSRARGESARAAALEVRLTAVEGDAGAGAGSVAGESLPPALRTPERREPGRRSGREPVGADPDLAAAADALSEGLVRVDSDLTVRAANVAAHALLGRRPGTIVGRSLIEATLDHRVEEIVRTASDRGAATGELAPRTRDGATLLVHARRAPSGDVWLALEDVSELRRLQRIRAEFIDNLSHELRTPLTNVSLLAETLGRDAEELPPRARDRVARIEIETGHLVQMVNELLDLAAIESGQPLLVADVDLAEVARAQVDRLALFAERQRVTLAIDAPGNAPPVRGDTSRLGQALLNLLHNAVKFSPPGGTVSVVVRDADDEVVVSVSDEGPGIPRDDLERIFERFYKVDRARHRGAGGTGLGLSIARHVVEGHGGRIWVESAEGVGSTFAFAIPRPTATEIALPLTIEPEPPAGGS